jgi:hypothetical protein
MLPTKPKKNPKTTAEIARAFQSHILWAIHDYHMPEECERCAELIHIVPTD